MDRIDALWWGGAFIWGALVLIAANIGLAESSWWDSGGVFFVGVGLLAFACAIIRLQTPQYRSKWLFSAIFGFVFLAIGLGAWNASWWLWALALLIAGTATLLSVFRQKN